MTVQSENPSRRTETYTIAEAAEKWIGMIKFIDGTPDEKTALISSVRAACPAAEAAKGREGNVALGSIGRAVFEECCRRIQREMKKAEKSSRHHKNQEFRMSAAAKALIIMS